MNFYASRGYLEAVAAVFYGHRQTAIEDVRIGDDVLRLLVVDGREIVTSQLFLDIHQPLAPSEVIGPIRRGRYARNVCRTIIAADDWAPERFAEMDLAPFVDWSQFADFGAYRDHLLKRHHGLIRDRERRGRQLEAHCGPLVFTVDDRRDDVLTLSRAWKSRQLRETGEPCYFDDPRTMEFLHVLRDRDLLVSSTLRAGGRLVSAWLGFIHDGTWSGWVFTFDPDLRKYSPGHQLVIRMLEESFGLGHREFDFSDGSHDYKMIYATHGRLLGEIGVPPLDRAMALFGKHALRRLSPGLLAAAQRAKRSIKSKLIRPRNGNWSGEADGRH